MSPVVLAPPALLPAASECQLLLAHHTCWQLPRHQRPSHLLRPHRRLLLQHTDQLPLLPQHAAQLMQWLAKTQLGPRKGEGVPKGPGDETALALAARLAPFAEQEGGHVRLDVCERLLAHACG